MINKVKRHYKIIGAIVMINVLVLVFLYVSSSTNTIAKNIETINGLSYQKPSIEYWTADKEKYDNVLIINWSTTQAPKKELSIVIEQSSKVNIHSEDFLKKIKKMLPPKTIVSEPSYTNEFGQESLLYDFTLPYDNYTLFGRVVSTYANGFLYEIIINRYDVSIDDDEELMDLLHSIKIQ